MKTTFAAIALVATIASAQLSAIPSCALTCLTDAIGTDGCSGLTDFKCHCSQPSLVSDVTPCVNAACSQSDIEKTITAVEKLCADAGAPITISQPAGSSTAAPSSTEAASSAPAETSAAASSAPAVSSPAVYSSAVVTSTVASTGGVTYPSSNSTVSSAPIPTFSGAANRVGGGLLAGAMAVVAVAL